MITDAAIWTVVINLIGLALAVQYSRSDSFNEALLWLLWDFTGLRFIVSKVFPIKKDNSSSPVTLTLWLIGIYTALFGIASNRYENSVDKIENRMNSFITQVAITKPIVRKTAFMEIREIQGLVCPVKPNLLKPSTVILSFVQNRPYDETITVLTRTVEKYRDNLQGAILFGTDLFGANLPEADLRGAELWKANLFGVNFWKANLQGAKMREAKLQKASLWAANLQGAELWKADLKDADLTEANLQGTNLRGANLQGAKLLRANLKDADLKEANIQGVYLSDISQICSVKSLYRAQLHLDLEDYVKQNCPKLFEYW